MQERRQAADSVARSLNTIPLACTHVHQYQQGTSIAIAITFALATRPPPLAITPCHHHHHPFFPCPQVQRFVQLCRSSGGSAQYRWNEQGVLGMVRHVFVQRQRLLMLGDISYIHRGQPGDNLRAGGLEP